ncbi:MAG: acylphosphatase [Chitinophagaceae bacterium]
MTSISILVKGKVQGVFYRQSAKEKALELGIVGQIKNQPDGSVFIIATGDEYQLTQFIKWCRTGPSRAVVSALETSSEPLQNFDTFNIIRH